MSEPNLSPEFKVVGAQGSDWRPILGSCLGQLDPLPGGANLALIYLTGNIGQMVDAFVGALRDALDVDHLFGAVATSVIIPGNPAWCDSGVVIAAGRLPDHAFSIVRASTPDRLPLRDRAFVHVDNAFLNERHGQEVRENAKAVGAFVDGTQGDVQIAAGLVNGGASCLRVDDSVAFNCGRSHGCKMLGPPMTVHSRSSGVIHGLDGRPVIDALRVLVGDLLIRRADTLRDHVMFVDVTDTQNSRLLPICSIDLRKGEIALGTEKLPDTLVLALRSPDAAFDDLDTTLKALGAGRGHEASRGLALHYASDRRRTGLFAPGIHEPEIVKRALGHTPVIGASFGHVAFGEQVHALSSVTAVIG